MTDKDRTSSWINEKLSSLLAFPVPPDLIDYICTIENERDFTEYFSSLLDFSNAEHVQFVKDLRQRLMPVAGHSQHNETLIQQSLATATGTSTKGSKKQSKQLGGQPTQQSKITKALPAQKLDKDVDNKERGKKKQSKYVNLYSQEGQARDVVLLKGRHPCTCEASKHQLINNCLKCGRIVCEQEGAGPCLFCGALVCTPEQQQQLEVGSKRSEKLRDHLMKQSIPKDTQIALQKRDKLLEYDKTSERLTKVIDDESDYYTPTSVWLSAEEQARLKQREAELHEQLHASRREKKFTLDFSGRCVIEEQPDLPIDPFKDPVLMKINQSFNRSYSMADGVEESSANPSFHQLQFIEPENTVHQFPQKQRVLLESRIQDRELQEMSDRGMCLSLHQPWASMVVSGLKLHEGRSWYTAHRGTLWIAAAAKHPTPKEIEGEEYHIRNSIGNPRGLKFPTEYPVGCLLGCVNMIDCLSQEEYQSQFPNGASAEPYVFILEHPRKLPICFPLRGKHKIFKLELKMHQAAQKSLKRVAKLQAQMTEDDD